MTREQIELLPSDEDIEFYRRHGYYISNKILPDQLLDAALAGTERFYAGDRDREPPPGSTPGWKPEDGTHVLRKNDFASFQLDEYSALVRYPLLAAVAARLAGESVRLWADQLLYKPPDGPELEANVGWHTDRKYWQCCTSTDMLTAWIPFRDCSETEGTVTMIDGSHMWPDNNDNLDFRMQDLDELESRFDTGSQPVVKTPIVMRRGQVSFHHCRTIHGSGANRGKLPRIALAVHLQNASNRWREHVYHMPDGSIRNHDVEILCRKKNGVPDFTDPSICPQLWPREDL